MHCFYFEPRMTRPFPLQNNTPQNSCNTIHFLFNITKGLTTPFTLSHLSCPQVYICGGFDGDQCLSSAEVFNPTTNQWSLIAPMSSRRSGVGVMAYGNQVYAVRANTTQHCSPLGGCSSQTSRVTMCFCEV